jgi:serine/threonine protein kinase
MGKTRKGGAYVAKGSYGCTFRKPPLKCRDEATRRNNSYVSKLITTRYADKELAQSNFFRKIDPEENYFVTVEKACDVNTANIKPENELEKCPFKPEESQLFLMHDAGISFDMFGVSSEKLATLIKSFTNLFDGLILAHGKNIIHHDIKPANIVIMPTADGLGFITRFIDFGLGLDLTNPPSEETIQSTTRIVTQLYAYYPFEQIIMYPLNLRNYHTFSEQKQMETIRYINIQYRLWLLSYYKYFNFIAPLYLTNKNTPLFNLNTIIEEVLAKNDTFTNYRDAYLYYFKACDVYMLGLTLTSFIERMGIIVTSSDSGEVDFTLKSSYVKNNIRTVGDKSMRINTPGFNTWFKELKTTFLKPLFDLIVGMTLPVAEDRLTIVQASQIFRTKVLKNIDIVLNSEKLNTYIIGN